MIETIVDPPDFPTVISEVDFVNAFKVFTEALGFDMYRLTRMDLRIGEMRVTLIDHDQEREVHIPIGGGLR